MGREEARTARARATLLLLLLRLVPLPLLLLLLPPLLKWLLLAECRLFALVTSRRHDALLLGRQ